MIGINIGIRIGKSIGNGGITPPPVLSDGNTFGWYNYENVVESGGIVSQMTDIGGIGNHLVQATESLRPTLTSDGVLFDGVDNYMRTSAGTLVRAVEIYLVVKQVTFTLFDKLLDGNGVNTMAYGQSGSAGTTIISAGTVLTNSEVAGVGVYNIHRLVFNGASSSIQIDETTKITGNAGTANIGGVVTLGANASGGNPSNIEVKELIVRNVADTSEDELAIYNYLKAKHGL